VQGNKVLRVGSNREIQRLARAQTTVVDAKGGSVLPGFNDAHVHMLSGGLSLDQVSLTDATTLDEIKETLKAWTVANPSHRWIRGRGWLYAPFPNGLPTRQLLDQLVPDRPAYLVSYDGHTGWANTAALEAAGITRATHAPANGVIVRDGRGEPTGILKESAMSLMSPALPVPSRDEELSALKAAVVEANRVGITSIQDAGATADDLALFDELRQRNDLSVRVYEALAVDGKTTADQLDAMDRLRARFDDDPLLKTGAVKLIADGVVETRTAAMLEPYTHSAERGELRIAPGDLTRLVTELDRRGWQVMTHAIGDEAIRETLNAYDPADPWAINLGPERAARGWMSGSLEKSGAPLAFGSDWPVAPLDPLRGIFVAVNRTNFDGEPADGWIPEERLSLADAIRAFTSGAAWASFDEQRKGTIERDMLADIVILSADVFALPPDRLLEAEVVMTIMDGKIVYRRDAAETDH
jgi:predicted amidohydrolase YtcJ